ncbi:hypothetical protein WN943_014016 [Citrus x changshan-huyou]
MEGLSMGVPFLCWPSFADQHHNRNYICDVWKIGVQLLPDENGIITRQEIQINVKALLKNDGIKANSLKLKEIARKILVEEKAETSSLMITVVSIPDRLEPHGAHRNYFQKVRQSMLRVMPGSCLKNLVEKVSESNDCQRIMFVIVDVSVQWTMEIAERWELRELCIKLSFGGGLTFALGFKSVMAVGVGGADGCVCVMVAARLMVVDGGGLILG